MRKHQTALRRTAVASAVVVATVLVIVALGYPDWLWSPLTISFWVAAAAFVVSAALELRSRFVRA
jgi:hypothetical protein